MHNVQKTQKTVLLLNKWGLKLFFSTLSYVPLTHFKDKNIFQSYNFVSNVFIYFFSIYLRF